MRKGLTRACRPVRYGVSRIFLAMLVALTFAAGAQVSRAQTQPVIVMVTEITHGRGTINAALFADEERWLQPGGAIVGRSVAAQRGRVQLVFENVPPGTYAVAVFHDENNNGALDTGLFGIPSEGYGFSEATTGAFGPPGFGAASFEVTTQPTSLIVELGY